MKNKVLSILFAMFFLVSAYAEELDTPDPVVDMVLGENTGDYYTEIELYYESGNGIELSTVTRTVYVEKGSNIIETALEELFMPAGTEFTSPMPGEAAIRSIEYGCGLVTVDLSVNIAGLHDEGELISVMTAISNTLTNIEGVEKVNILVNSRSEDICGIPTGLFSASDASTSAIWANYQAESTNLLESEIPISRSVALYFPSANGQWLLPDIRMVYFSDEAYADELINELIIGTASEFPYMNFLTGGISMLTEDARMFVTSSGERVLEISLSSTLSDYLMLQGIPEWQAAGAITMTMCSFVPELDAVRLNIGNETIDRLNIRGVYHDFKDGLMRRDDFSMYSGSVSTLYFADENDKLKKVSRSISSERALSAYTLITQLISGPSSVDTDVSGTMPAGVTAKDILGIKINDGTAYVNLTSNFYRLCQMLNCDEERILIYSIVNTLCTLPGISSVQFLIEGEHIETLAGNICLMHELLPNPGLIQ